MKKMEKIKKKTLTFLYDHQYLRFSLKSAKAFLYAIVGAIIYAFAFSSFITPAVESTKDLTIVTGGVGGFSQVIILVVRLCGGNADTHTLQSVLYFLLNLPLLIFAFFMVGKRFAVGTAINVVVSSLFISLFSSTGVSYAIASHELIANSPVARTLFAAVLIGFGSAVAYRGDVSAGGIDIVSYYFALRKSTSVGKYALGINLLISTSYILLSIPFHTNNLAFPFITLLYSLLYLFVDMLIVDVINIRNKKVQIQIITKRKDMNDILIANFAHSTTYTKAYGGYTGDEEYVIYIIVLSSETKKTIDIIKKIDSSSFITITSLIQVYGNFFNRPVE